MSLAVARMLVHRDAIEERGPAAKRRDALCALEHAGLSTAWLEARDLENGITIGEDMSPGLYLFCVPSGSLVVLRIAYVRKANPQDPLDYEYEAHNMVTPLRGGDFETHFATLTSDGPPANWQFTKPIAGISPQWRPHMIAPVPLQPEQWTKVCPMPKRWSGK